MSATGHVRVFYVEPEPPRALTLHELRRLKHLGFDSLAVALAAGVCPKCEGNRAGSMHRDLCIAKEAKRRPHEAAPEPPQPWVPRAPRQRAA